MSATTATLDLHPVGTELDRVCASCGQHYVWVSEAGRQRATIYCSKRCRRRKSPERRVQRIPLTEASPETMQQTALLICARCWVPFGWSSHEEASDSEAPLYHSLSCRYKAKEGRKKARADAHRATRKVTRQEELERREAEEQAASLAAISAAARELLLPASHCPTCGKVANPTKEAAKAAKRAIEQRAGRTNEVRYYQCDSGWWHWTRMDATLDGFRARTMRGPR